jgi:hypothetical protein
MSSQPNTSTRKDQSVLAGQQELSDGIGSGGLLGAFAAVLNSESDYGFAAACFLYRHLSSHYETKQP